MKLIPLTMKAIALLLALSCYNPGTSQAVSVPAAQQTVSSKAIGSVKNAVLNNISSRAAVPSPLEDFSKDVLSELSHQAEFQDWNHATITYYPLGPGTHGWLAAVSQGNRQIGYLIFTARENGGFMLSEYGSEESMPYSYEDLHRRLVQESIIPSASEIPESVKIEAEYTSMLPVWKVTPRGKKSLYINALTAELLPVSDTAVGKVKLPQGMSSGQSLHLESASLSSGKERSDPYDNLLWLTAPRLNVSHDSDLLQAISIHDDSLIFMSPGHNAAYGAPFSITGLQTWSLAKEDATVLYVATGTGGSRYLPLSMLLDTGEFRVLPSSNR